MIKTPIIPIYQQVAKHSGAAHLLDKKAVCIYMATGFFLETDSFYQDEQILQSGKQYKINEQQKIVASESYFNWNYSPRNISFQTALDEFTDLFEQIITEQTNNRKVILPLSGGLDSRSQAVALHHTKAEVQSYSYAFKNGYKEHSISKQITKQCGFPFEQYTILPGYLWDVLEELAAINGCYSEFTHARQMAVLPQLKEMEGVFSLGHWGDVLFDRGVAAVDEDQPEVTIVLKKIVKKGGMELATALWKQWNLEGTFESYLKNRIQKLLDKIEIENTSAKIRAFKSLYWAPRWTSINLSIFEAAHPITLPYYDNRMCEFICTIPEEYLADRKLQIAYIKQRNPKVARVRWQDNKPYNLFNYHKNKSPQNLPYRIKNKLIREIQGKLGKKYIQRNWELQFLGEENDKQLASYIFQKEFMEFIGEQTVTDIYEKFKTKDAVFYSHAVSMLLTLSVWYKQKNSPLEEGTGGVIPRSPSLNTPKVPSRGQS